MSTQIHLAADLGAESGRIIAGHWDGQKLETEEIHRFPNQPIQDSKSLRWNIHALHEEILKGIGIAGTRFGSRVRSVGIDTWGVDYVLLSRSQELLGLPYHYRDPRTGGVMERFFATMPR
ncbi:MAG: rhamnulokinase, partial [Verrucomicrobia bacterium]|nr:rhamnulokinase [Verrucomicrobiota bacterium]